MGCDIHEWVEIQHKSEDDKYSWWEDVGTDMLGRHYGLYGWLAGVRNYSAVEPIKAPAGFPEDASISAKYLFENYGSDAHTPSYLTIDELLAVNYDQVIVDRRVTRQISPNYFDGGCTGSIQEGKEVVLRDFLGAQFMAILEYMKTLRKTYDNVRLVFFFDN